MLGAGTGAQPFRSVRDYDNWLARAARIPALSDQAIANMREGVAQGLVQPRVLIEKTIPQFDALIDANPEKTIFWKPIETLPADFRSEEHTSELQSLMRISYAVFCLNKQKKKQQKQATQNHARNN